MAIVICENVESGVSATCVEAIHLTGLVIEFGSLRSEIGMRQNANAVARRGAAADQRRSSHTIRQSVDAYV